MIALALVSLASTAEAKPKRRDAKLAFDRGVTAYKKGNFEAASEALGKSFDLERDVDTLFAWAQSERKLEHCEKAIELYEKLLTFDLPAANKEAVDTKLTECRTQLLLNDHKAEPSPVTPPPVTPPPVAPKVESTAEPPPVAEHAVIAPVAPPMTDTPSAGRAWYKDPIAIGLVGTGTVATGIGVGFLISANSAHNSVNDKTKAPNYDDAQRFLDQAQSRRKIGLVATGAGGALLIGGVVWIVTHRHATEQHAVTGWLAPGSGGLAVTGAF